MCPGIGSSYLGRRSEVRGMSWVFSRTEKGSIFVAGLTDINKTGCGFEGGGSAESSWEKYKNRKKELLCFSSIK